jgi:signal transduction histidine kinase
VSILPFVLNTLEWRPAFGQDRFGPLGSRPAMSAVRGRPSSRTELAQLKRLAELRRRVQDLSLLFSKSISSSLNLAGALEVLAQTGNALLGTRRTSVWVYDRRAWQLALTASSDPGFATTAARVASDDPRAPAARGLRLESPQILSEQRESTLIAPLRGWRRALGTLVIEGAPRDLDEPQFTELAQEFARQLSVGIENVQLLEEIQRQRRLLEDTFNSLADLVVVADKSGRVVQVNDAFVERIGGPASSLLNKALAELVGSEIAVWAGTPDVPPPPGGAAIASSRRFDDERLGGAFAATVTPLINQEGQPVGRVLVMRDITVQTRLEAEQEALRARLGQSEKLASLGQFVAGIAHEMNNPLQGVLGHLELLIEMSEEARPVRRELKRIYQEADRAAKIVRNLLMFTGSRRVARRRLRVDRVLARALASRRAALQRAHISVVSRHAKDLASVTADPLLLQQAFLNILINAEHAITASGKRGRIEIRTMASSGGERIAVTIRDTGAGIPADVLPRIFDPFFTTKEVGQGTGLGLAITYGIIKEHGGTVQAANAPNGGAIFTIELPADAKG